MTEDRESTSGYGTLAPKEDPLIPDRPDVTGVATLKAARLGPNSYLATEVGRTEDRMTVAGVIVRTSILFGILVVCAAIPWSMALAGSSVGGFFWGGLVAAFVLSIVISFRPQLAPVLGPAYAACEGFCLGALSGMLEVWYRGIAAQAIQLTFCVFVSMLAIHLLWHPARNKTFRTGVIGAMGAILVIYLLDIFAGFVGLAGFSFLHESTPLAIGIAAVFLVIAALSLTLDFQFIEESARAGAPRDLEWYAAFSLMISIVWIYVQALRLLSLLRSR
jgi:uncharacterized YccA/Bax inhibitor family protein